MQVFELVLCAACWGVEEEEAENCGLLSGQGVNSCRRHGAGQGEKPRLMVLSSFTPCVR